LVSKEVTTRRKREQPRKVDLNQSKLENFKPFLPNQRPLEEDRQDRVSGGKDEVRKKRSLEAAKLDLKTKKQKL
jgi:hypothetical protein